MTFPIVNLVWALAVFAGAMVNAMAAAETNTKPGTRMRFSHIALKLDELGTQARDLNTRSDLIAQDQRVRPKGAIPATNAVIRTLAYACGIATMRLPMRSR
jgi:hypothetical protein